MDTLFLLRLYNERDFKGERNAEITSLDDFNYIL